MDTYYQMLDRESSTVSPLWKALHILSLATAISGGFATAYTFGRTLEFFGNNCFLFAHISFQEQNMTFPGKSRHSNFGLLTLPGHLKPIDVPNSRWGSQNLCYFCQFTPVMAMIAAIIWLTFFIICSRGGAGFIQDTVYRPWRIVYPALIFATASTTLLLLSTLEMSSGINAFCEQFEKVFHKSGCIRKIDQYTLSFYPEEKRLTAQLKVALGFSYLCFTGWFSQLIILVMRVVCITDFQLIRITVTNRDEPGEEVLKVVNPEYGIYTKGKLLAIPEDTTLSPEDTTSPSPSSTEKEGKSKRKLFRHKRKTADLHRQPPTDTLNETDLSLNVTEPKVKVGQHRVSFGPSPQEGAKVPSSDNLGEKAGGENIVLTILNGQVDLNQNTEVAILPNAKETALYSPRSVIDNM